MIEHLVVAGARGFLAEHMFRGLARLGIVPLTAVDNNPDLWGKSASGTEIIQPSQAVTRFPHATFVAAVHNHTPLRRQLQQLGAKHVISYAVLFRKYPGVFLPYLALDVPSKMAENRDAIEAASAVWADRESRDLYSALTQWFKTLDAPNMPAPLSPQETYFPSFLRLRQDEVFVDCGAFEGDTLRQYLQLTRGAFSSIVCIEPDPQNFERLRRLVQSLSQKERIVLLHAAITHEHGSVRFAASGNVASHTSLIGDEAEKVIEVPGVQLDDLSPRPTFVKMDIEGSEVSAIKSAEGLLRGGQTAWAVTLYHHLEDFWRIPLYFRRAAPELRLFLRHYAEDYAETICYAVPPERVTNTERCGVQDGKSISRF